MMGSRSAFHMCCNVKKFRQMLQGLSDVYAENREMLDFLTFVFPQLLCVLIAK